jgi:hypothetical protein
MPIGTNPQLETFLKNLYPWSQEQLNLYKTVTWTFIKDGKKQFANYSAQTYERTVQLAESRMLRPQADCYMALGTMRMAEADKFSVDGHPKAIRQASNIVSHNAIYLDVDVKPGAYNNTDEAFLAVDDFINQTGLPPATMEVLSGSGGAHIYWCTTDPMPIAKWIPLATGLRDAALAYGLKFDPQVTVNPAGVLRVPGSFNYKTNPPGRVELLDDSSGQLYGYDQLCAALKVSAQAQARTMGASYGTTGHSAAYAGYIDNTPEAYTPPLDDVAAVCPTIRDILTRGGNGDAEPLWNMAVLLASFTDNPVASAHRLSSGDPRYVPADTDKKLHEKINARAANSSIGWPQCAGFSALSPTCHTCPLLVLNKSPLSHVKRPVPVMAQLHRMPGQQDPLLPQGYFYDVNKHIFTTVIDDKGTPLNFDVLGCPVVDAAVDATTGHLVLRATIGGEDRWCDVQMSSSLTPQGAAEMLARSRIFPKPVNYKHARDLLVAWVTKLQEIKRTITPASFGWTADGKGFTFGEMTYRDGGNDIAFRGNTIEQSFGTVGELQPWQDAMALAYGRPALETLVATAFASPLVALVSPFSLVLSAYSRESGVGKSTSLALAQAVWGHPRDGMTALHDTYNSVMKKAQDLKSLPLYWDELRTKDSLEKVIDLVFGVAQGKAKSRLNRDATQAAAGSFTTMFLVASNYGIGDTVYSKTDGTEAGGLRVFEMQIPVLGTTSVSDSKSRQMVVQLASNYGNAGARYAEFIVRNLPTIRKRLSAYAADLETSYQFSSKERFWATTMATIIMGASLANAAGITTFDINAIQGYLDKVMGDQRVSLQEAESTTLSNPDAAVNLLNDLISSVRGRHLITTDVINYGTGRPGKVNLLDIEGTKNLDHVWVQRGDKDGRVRAIKHDFDEWMRKRHHNPKQVIDLLKKDYFVSVNKQTIGSGIVMLDASIGRLRRYCYDFTPINSYPGSTPGSS